MAKGLPLLSLLLLKEKINLEPSFSQASVVMPDFSEDIPGGYWWIIPKANYQIIFCFLHLGYVQSLVVSDLP